MRKTKRKKISRYPFIISFLMVFFVTIIVYKSSNFNKSIPDVVELPEEVKQSIKNVKPQKFFKIPILLYHYVEYVKDPKDTIRQSLNIVPFIFEEQVKTLKQNGFTFLTTSDLADALDGKKTLPIKSVVLTFDDGYQDFYTDVFPILKKYQAKAVVFVVPNFLDKQNNLSIEQLKELSNSSLIEIGAHTMNHLYLSGLSSIIVKNEVEESKKFIEKIIGKPVVSFAYPYGAFDNETIDIVKKAGFTSAVTTVSGDFILDINRFFLYRVRPGIRVGNDLVNFIGQSNLAKY